MALSPATNEVPGVTLADSGLGENETAALLNVLATGVMFTGACGAGGLDAFLIGGAHTDLIQRSAASGDLGICLRWAAVGQTGLATGFTEMPLGGFGAGGAAIAGVLV